MTGRTFPTSWDSDKTKMKSERAFPSHSSYSTGDVLQCQFHNRFDVLKNNAAEQASSRRPAEKDLLWQSNAAPDNQLQSKFIGIL
jgi:hypothetical protein